MMYSQKVDTQYYNVSLDGVDLIMEECTPNEAYNRRETIRHNIIGGTQTVMRGNYLVRDYTFITHVLIDPQFPDVYDKVFKEWQSKPVEVISKHMGGKFKAEVIIKKHQNDSPHYLSLEIQVIEIPDKSVIPNDVVDLPVDKISPVKVTSKSKNDKKGKNSKGKMSKADLEKLAKQALKNKGKNITKNGVKKGK